MCIRDRFRGYSSEHDEWIHESGMRADEAVSLYHEILAEKEKPKRRGARTVARLVSRKPSRTGTAQYLCALEKEHGPADYLFCVLRR